ncbi:ABC-type transport system involved in cytochrome bd biosynthesis, fused ATPase and permease components [Weissella viridescens]|uniref:ABC-type transport system involved in cytochrome bd biosynthesis, fused ATPase and permease components n=1 Tax=Weissella viridescens TaxID=1629 RepID=A0A380P8T0_WEIVI|nr:ABC-type transport system involved in cytochrome bd biosynthesis, fused ATPase and permease components [Weissella viridescens]
MVYAPIVLTRAFGIGRPSFRYAERLTSHNWVLRIVSSFRKKLYEIVESGTKSIYAHVQTGEVFNLMANDLFKIEICICVLFSLVSSDGYSMYWGRWRSVF